MGRRKLAVVTKNYKAKSKPNNKKKTLSSIKEEPEIQPLVDDTTDDIPELEDISDIVVEDVDEVVPDVVGEVMPDILVEVVPDVVGDDMPDILVEDVPDILVEDVPDVVGDDISDDESNGVEDRVKGCLYGINNSDGTGKNIDYILSCINNYELDVKKLKFLINKKSGNELKFKNNITAMVTKSSMYVSNHVLLYNNVCETTESNPDYNECITAGVCCMRTKNPLETALRVSSIYSTNLLFLYTSYLISYICYSLIYYRPINLKIFERYAKKFKLSKKHKIDISHILTSNNILSLSEKYDENSNLRTLSYVIFIIKIIINNDKDELEKTIENILSGLKKSSNNHVNISSVQCIIGAYYGYKRLYGK